jgi:hypothetical protein
MPGVWRPPPLSESEALFKFSVAYAPTATVLNAAGKAIVAQAAQKAGETGQEPVVVRPVAVIGETLHPIVDTEPSFRAPGRRTCEAR